jgi:hypothetical protein
MSIVDNVKLEERAWENRVCAVRDGEAVLILIAAEGQVAVYDVCLPSTSMIRPVVFLGAPTAQGTRCGARRKDGDGYGSRTIDRANDDMLLRREWTPAQVEAAVGWFKGMNAQGQDIYIRPTGSSGLYLIDDVPAATVERMQAEGYTPAAVVETSPGNL